MFLFPFSGWVSAQGPVYYHYTEENGLPSNTIYDVAEDRDGFIWLATDQGVSRFDGTTFRNFTTENGLPDNEILKLYADTLGRVWFCNITGLFGYFEKGRIISSHTAPLFGLQSFRSHLTSVHQDQNGNLWFTINANGCFLLRNKRFIHLFPGRQINLLNPLSTGKIMLTSGDVTMSLNMTRRLTTLMQIDPVSLKVDSLSQFIGGSKAGLFSCRVNDSIVLGFNNDGLHLWNLNTDIATPISRPLHLEPLITGRIQMYKPDHALISMRSRGAIDLSFREGYREFSLDHHYLDGTLTNCVLADKVGHYWFGTMSDGLFYLPDKSLTVYESPQLTSPVLVKRIATDPVTDECFVSAGAGIFQATDSLREIFHFHNVNAFFSREMVVLPGEGVLAASDMFLSWVPGPSVTSNTYWIDLETINNYRYSHYLPYLHPSLPVGNYDAYLTSSQPIKALLKDHGNSVWVATSGGIWLAEVHPEIKGPGALISSRLIASKRVNHLAWASGHTLWVAGESGLMKLSGDSLKVMVSQKEGLRSRITRLITLPDSSLVFSTHGQGIYHLTDGRLRQFTRETGLVSDLCNDLFLDHENQLWVGTTRGISVFRWTGSELLLTSNPAAPLLGEKNIECIVRHKDALVFSSRGFIFRLPIPSAYQSKEEFEVLITDAEVNAGGRPLKPEDQLSPDENNIVFRFVGLDFPSHGDLSYQYRLLSSDTLWSSTVQNSIEFSSLPAGSYSFEVRAFAADGRQSSNIATYAFTILPRFYQTLWFRISAAILFIGLVGFLARTRVRSARRRNQLELRMLESEQKALRSQMNPHFIFNSLNSIQRFLANNNPNESIRYLTKFGRLIRSILDHSRESAIPIGEELNALRLYIELESLRTGHKFDAEIILDEKLDELGDKIPPLLLQPYVENAIWHGIMAKEGRGKITISLLENGNSIRCCIEDNGIGRTKARELKGSNPTGSKSHGMNITAERLALLNRDKPRTITVQITDLLNSDGTAAGTKVEMNIPKNF